MSFSYSTDRRYSSLPRITEQVQQKAENIDARLKELPEPLDSNLALSVMVELLQFERQLKESIDGGQKTNSFHKEWNQWALRFRQELAETRPTLLYQGLQVPVHSQSPNGNQNLFGTPTPVVKNSAAISIDSDESDNPDNMESPSKLSPLPPRVGQKRPVVSAYTTPKKLQRATAEFSASKKPKMVSSKKFSLQEIRNILQDAYIGLHNLIDPKAIEKMIRLSMEHWEHPLSQFLAQTRKLCEVMVFQQIQDVYAKYSETQYYEQIRQICERFFDKAFTEQTQLLMRILEWEQSRPMTCNDEAINLAQSKAFTLLETKRRETRATAYLNEQEARLGKPSSGQARVDKLAKVTDSQLGPDPYKKEIEAMTVSHHILCSLIAPNHESRLSRHTTSAPISVSWTSSALAFIVNYLRNVVTTLSKR